MNVSVGTFHIIVLAQFTESGFSDDGNETSLSSREYIHHTKLNSCLSGTPPALQYLTVRSPIASKELLMNLRFFPDYEVVKKS